MESDIAAPPATSRISAMGFLFGFGFGIFVGVALALLAVFSMREADKTTFVVAPITESDGLPSTEVITPVPTPDARPRTTVQLDVRLGPGNSFGVVGLLNRDEAVVPVGRDTTSDWIAIQFPAGSSGRGWVPVSALDSVVGLDDLAVAIATPLPRVQVTVAAQTSGSGQPSAFGQSGLLPGGPESSDLQTAVVSRTAVATPIPEATGPVDLVVIGVSLQSDGRVLVTVGNRGPGDLRDQSIFVHIRDLSARSEQIATPVTLLRVGQTITISSTSFRVSEPEDIVAVVDPFATANEVDRSNNSLQVTLAPPRVPTPTPAPGGG